MNKKQSILDEPSGWIALGVAISVLSLPLLLYLSINLTISCVSGSSDCTTFLDGSQVLPLFVIIFIIATELSFVGGCSEGGGFWDIKGFAIIIGVILTGMPTLILSLLIQRPNETLEFVTSLGPYILIAGGVVLFFAINYLIYMKKSR